MNDTETAAQRVAQRQEQEAALRGQLALLEFDGPYEIRSGDVFGGIGGGAFGLGPTRYAICLRCAAMVRLDDAEERDGRQIERSLRIHGEWHEEVSA